LEEIPLVQEHIPLPSENLPVQRPVIMRRITSDIHVDRRNSKIVLREREADEEPHLMKRGTVKQRIQMDVALDRHHTMNRKLTQKDDANKAKIPTNFARENKGGNAAWEALRSTNNPQAYKAATLAASERFVQRRSTALAAAMTAAMTEDLEGAPVKEEESPINQSEVALSKEVANIVAKQDVAVEEQGLQTRKTSSQTAVVKEDTKLQEQQEISKFSTQHPTNEVSGSLENVDEHSIPTISTADKDKDAVVHVPATPLGEATKQEFIEKSPLPDEKLNSRPTTTVTLSTTKATRRTSATASSPEFGDQNDAAQMK